MMHKVGLNILSLVFISLFFMSFFDLINYDKSLNPDIYNYIANFYNKNWTYDIGFEFYQSIIRDMLHYDFNSFWVISLTLIVVLYVLNGFSYSQLPFLIVNYFFLAAAFGTQIRYFIAALLFTASLNYLKGLTKYFVFLVSSFFHYGVFIFFACFEVTKILEKRKELIVRYAHYILFGALILYFLSTTIVVFILPYTRFAYYLDSHYMDAKSTASFIYAIFSLVILFFYFKRLESNDRVLNFTLLLLYLVVSTSSIAVLSGRLLLVYLVLEVVVSKSIFNVDKRFYYVLFMLSFTKVIPSMFKFISSLF